MNKIATAEIVKLRAREKAIQNATKQAGVVLLSYSRFVNSELTEDEISAITSTKYEMLGEPSYKRIVQQITDVTTAIVWRATVNVNVDNEEIQNWINLDAVKKAELIAQNKNDTALLAENDRKAEDLRQQYPEAKTDDEKARIKAELEKTDKEFLEVLAVKKFRQDRFLETHDYDGAEAAYTEAIELIPDYALAYFYRGKLYFHSLKDNRRALEDFTKVIELQPQNVEAYCERGSVYASFEDYKEDYKHLKLALADLDKAIEINLNCAEAYAERGHTYSHLKEHEKAVEDYTQAIKLDSKRDFYYVLRGETFMKLKDYNRAIKDFTAAIKIIPTDSAYYIDRAECYENLGEYQTAVEDYTTAINIEPDFGGNYAYRGKVYFILKDYRRALADYDKAIKIDPNFKPHYKDRAEVYEALGEHEKAQADLAKADKKWYYDESNAEESEDSQTSIEELTEMINSNPNDADAYCNRGLVRHKLKEYQKAVKDYTKAIEINPAKKKFYKCRANSYLRLNDMDKYAEDLARY